MRRQRIAANDFPAAFQAVAVNEKRMRPLGSFGSLLWVEGRVVAGARLLSSAAVTDGTRLRAVEPAAIGKLGPAGWQMPPRAMVRLLIEAGVIRRYWNLDREAARP